MSRSGTRSGISALMATALYLAASGSAYSQAPTDFSRLYQDAPTGYVSAGALTMQRSTPGGGAIVAGNPGGTPSFRSGRDFDFGWNTGIDATIGVRFWQKEAIEVRFMNFSSNSGDSFTTPGGFIGAGFTGPGGTLFQGGYETRMQSWELNWRHQLFDQLNVLAGARYISADDMLFYKLNGNVATGKYNYRNNLFGAQVGADWALLPMASPFQINVFGKIGLYSVQTKGGIDEFQGNNYIGGFYANQRDTTWGSEAGATIGYRIGNNVLLRAGYQVLWLNDIGLASNNASASLLNPSLLRSVYRGDLVLQGVNFGMTVSY